MDVSQAIEHTRAWVEVQARRMPGFCGAHLMGGILALPKDAPLPAYKDVDFNIVCEGVRETETFDVAWQGLILEYSVVGVERYCAAEDVLASPDLASNLAAAGILSDPRGLLAPLSQAVAEQYARRRWVQARCDYERRMVVQCLDDLRRAETPLEARWHVLSAGLFLSGLLAEASLRPPTHRRCLVLMHDVLREQGREDLHEAALRLLGFGQVRREQVESYLDDCAAAFDRAAEVTRTPVPFQFKLQPHVRPYIVDGAREMIDQGCHREAMFWIGGFLMFANAAIQADAPAQERPIYQAKVDRLAEDLGFGVDADVAARAAAMRDLAEAIFGVADALAARACRREAATSC